MDYSACYTSLLPISFGKNIVFYTRSEGSEAGVGDLMFQVFRED